MLEELSKPYGCYGIVTMEAIQLWQHQFNVNSGVKDTVDCIDLIIWDQQTDRVTMWKDVVLKNE